MPGIKLQDDKRVKKKKKKKGEIDSDWKFQGR